MHLAFVDITCGYTADRPESGGPVGGTTSAVCFTARALVKAGVTCTFFNKIAAPAAAHGIKSYPVTQLAHAVFETQYDAFIFCGRWLDDMVRFIKAQGTAKLIGWMHESSFTNTLVAPLPEFDGVAYVSDWQKRVNASLASPHWQDVVIRNAMNPAFATLFEPGTPILAAKSKPPLLAYSGSFPRGAFHVPPLLDELRKIRTGFTMEMYCNTNPSGDEIQDGKYIDWLRGLRNIAHVGYPEGDDYPRRMKSASVLVAPNPWPETSCIALIEAMAAGLSIVTTNRAVLPETAAGFARHIPIEDPDDSLRFNAPINYKVFAAAVSAAMDEQTETGLRAQVDYALSHYQWDQRVGDWTRFIQSLQA